MASFLLIGQDDDEFVVELKFSSLSESGFIPTLKDVVNYFNSTSAGSHLFQRVASFLLLVNLLGGNGLPPTVLISFREWLHSY